MSSQAALDLHKTLPVGTYTVKQDPMTGAYYLEQIENFEVKGKVYGDTQNTATRILDTFEDRPASTGVMLSGEKGSGKTLLAKMLSLDGQMRSMPTIVINQPHCGDEFNGFMQMIEQPTVVIFDEFEKVYNTQEQEKMLTLLDGVYPSKKLFVITCNDKWRVNEHMRNRPGRIYYRLDYTGLEREFIVEYCEDNLNDTTHIETVCRMATLFSQFNFDILKAMVEEMNRYGETPQDVMKVLNAKPEQGDNATYTFELQVDGKTIPSTHISDNEWKGNPLGGKVSLHYMKDDKNDDDDSSSSWKLASFTVEDLVTIDAHTGAFEFSNRRGENLSLARVKAAVLNYHSF